MKVPLIGIDRHRLGCDGKGVTTLVTFHGCPLRCHYCLNPQCFTPKGIWKEMSPEEVYQIIVADNLYFLATDGGVTFGGGEPCLQSKFIREFCLLADPRWNIRVETSLHVERRHLMALLPFVQQFIVDVKDMNAFIYKNYTRKSNRSVINNLNWLAKQGVADRVRIRLPLIPDYNTSSDVHESRKRLENMGFTHFDEFTYIKNVRAHKELLLEDCENINFRE